MRETIADSIKLSAPENVAVTCDVHKVFVNFIFNLKASMN